MAAPLFPTFLLTALCTAPPAGDKAVGVFDVRTAASPLAVEVGEPFLLTLEILGRGPTRRAPTRPRLQNVRTLAANFDIDDLPDPAVTAQPNRWTFRYRLRPKGPESRRVPSIAFEYQHPNGQEQTAYSEPILLELKPRSEPVEVKGGALPGEYPEAIRRLASGPEVLRRDADPGSPAGWVWVLLAAAPPVGCWLWYAAWLRSHPDAGRRARLHRSLSGGRAIRALRKLRRDGDGSDHAAEVVAVVTGYLADQLHFTAKSLTPREASLRLVQADVPAETVAKVAEFFRTGDALRYAPEADHGGQLLAEEAERIIVALEAETCFARRR
jgi:hypothetical protein